MQTAFLREACHPEQIPRALQTTLEHPGAADPHVEGQEVEVPSRRPIEHPALHVFLQPRHIEDGIRREVRFLREDYT